MGEHEIAAARQVFMIRVALGYLIATWVPVLCGLALFILKSRVNPNT